MWIIILLISRQERDELAKMGHKFGNNGDLHRTYTKHKKYYLTESEKALADLQKIRDAKVKVK